MSHLSISFEPGGIAKFSRTFTRFAEYVDDLSQLFRELGRDFRNRIEPQQFSTEGGESGGWASLSPEYEAWKSRHYSGSTILVRTGALRSSLAGKAGSITRINKWSAELGTSVPYAGYHQSGTSKMPKRPPIDLSQASRHQWVQIVHKFLSEARDSALGPG